MKFSPLIGIPLAYLIVVLIAFAARWLATPGVQ